MINRYGIVWFINNITKRLYEFGGASFPNIGTEDKPAIVERQKQRDGSLLSNEDIDY